MSWNVEIVRKEFDYNGGKSQIRDCAPVCVLTATCERLDADNLRILIDALHCALDILKPDWAPTPKEME